MFIRRIPLFKPRNRKGGIQRNSLVRVVLVVMLLLSLVPVLIIGVLSFYRSRALVTEQIEAQLANIISSGENPIKNMIISREEILARLLNDPAFTSNVEKLAAATAGTDEFNKYFSSTFIKLGIYFDYRSYQLTSATGTEEIIVMRPDGTMLIETTQRITYQAFGSNEVTHPFIMAMMGKSAAFLTYNVIPVSPDNVVYIVTRPIKNIKGETVAQLVMYGVNPAVTKALQDTQVFYPGSRAFYYTSEGDMVGLFDPLPGSSATAPKRTLLVDPEKNIMPLLKTSIENTDGQFFATKKNDQNPVVIFSKWMPEYGMGMGIEVPEMAVYAQSTFLDPVNTIVLILTMLVSGTLIYLGTTRLVRPLVTLANTADNFSKGKWSERTNIKRNDEIGLLASAFNHMADELSDMYQSLEKVVEKRTSQIRTASEVAQMAASTNNLTETLSRTVELIADRFGYYHTALYLVDETGHSLVLSEAGGVASSDIKQRGDRVEMIANSLIGWVSINNKSRVIDNVHLDELYRPNPLLADTLSEVAIPVSIGTEIMGVLDIQSTLADAFDNETVSVLQTLANQISSTLHNTRLLETTQVSYQETSLLYRATRQVTQAQGEPDIIQILTDTFVQLPYVSLILDVKEDQFKVMVVTDSKTGRVDRNLVNITIPIRNMGQILLDNRVNLIDIGKSSEFDNILSFLFRRGCKTAALLSVVERGQLSKVLAFGSREAELISHTSLQPYANLAEVIGTSLEKFHVLESLQLRLNELQALTNFSQAISVETEIDHLFDALHEQVSQSIGADISFAIAIYNESDNTIEVSYQYEGGVKQPPLEPFPMGKGPTSYVITNRKPLMVIKDTEKQMKALGAIESGAPALSWMGVPLIVANQVVGVMVIQDELKEERFTSSDLTLFNTLAPQIATAVRNAQLLLETRDALKAYQLEHFLMNSLLDNSPDAIYFKDTEGKYIRASQSIADFYKLPVESIPGKTDFELLDDPELAELLWSKQKAILDARTADTEVFKQKAPFSGEEYWWQLSGVPIFESQDAENPYGLLIIQKNITDIKNAEALAERRAEQILTAAEIARDTTGTLEVEELLKKLVNLVRDRFGFYHASIFLLDTLGEYAVLRESTGTAGAQMMQTGHRLAVGSKSIVGTVTSQNKPLTVNDVMKDPNYYPNPLLPETRSELAIPLSVGDRLLGALDVQSRQVNAFSEEDINVLQILADQLAVALSNADLFAKTQELLGKHRLLRQITVAASASTTLEDTLLNVVKGLRTAVVADRIEIMMLNDEGMLQTQASAGYEGTQHLEIRIPLGQGIVGSAAVEKRPVKVDNTQADSRYISLDDEVKSELAIPILFSEELMGVLNMESTKISAFDENDVEILGALGSNLGGVIANLRLVQRVRRQVERERLLFDITSKIRRSVDLNTILETSTREIARAIGAHRARIQITAGASLSKEVETGTEADQAISNTPAIIPPINGNGSSKNGSRKNGASGKNGQEAK